MREWYYKLSLQKKILYSELFLAVISFLVLLVFAALSFRQERRAELAHMRQYNQQLNLNLDTILASTDSLKYFHLSDNKVRCLLLGNDKETDPRGYQETEQKLRDRLSLLADMGGYVLRANIVTTDGRAYENIVENAKAYQNKMNQAAQKVVWEYNDQCVFTGVEQEEVSQVEYQVISMIYRMWDVNRREPVGMLYLDLDFGKIKDQLNTLAGDSADSAEFLILNQEGVLFDSGEDGADGEYDGSQEEKLKQILGKDKPEGYLTLNGEACSVVVMRNEQTGWYLVQYIPIAYLTEKILKNMWVVLLLILAALLVAISGSYFFSRQVSRPVKVLSQVMEQVAADGENDKEVSLLQADNQLWENEIGAMIRSYNAMARRINGNIIQSYQYQLNQKQTELKMLQFQINPHFLYNALNTISAIARLQEVEYIPEIADSLSEMFRYNIKGKAIVTIREELKQLENYLLIQKIRFPKRFQTEYEVEESLLDCEIIKFVFQPIVENSFRHGFVHKKEKDILKIKVEPVGADAVISIEDNGEGIPGEKVRELNEAFRTGQENASDNRSIGLQNVNYRLRNYYGEGYGIQMESEQGRYTRVRLRIRQAYPAVKTETGGTAE